MGIKYVIFGDLKNCLSFIFLPFVSQMPDHLSNIPINKKETVLIAGKLEAMSIATVMKILSRSTIF